MKPIEVINKLNESNSLSRVTKWQKILDNLDSFNNANALYNFILSNMYYSDKYKYTFMTDLSYCESDKELKQIKNRIRKEVSQILHDRNIFVAYSSMRELYYGGRIDRMTSGKDTIVKEFSSVDDAIDYWYDNYPEVIGIGTKDGYIHLNGNYGVVPSKQSTEQEVNKWKVKIKKQIEQTLKLAL